MNGYLSEPFPINSGVPQGCPLSPVAFLFIAEGLTRLIEHDETMKGIRIGGETYKISQFADDTCANCGSAEDVTRVMQLLEIFCKASGMKLNASKTEGIQLGAARRKTPPVARGNKVVRKIPVCNITRSV